MISVTRSAIILLLVSGCTGFLTRAQSQVKPSVKLAVVVGTVTIKGKPAAGIVVGLRMSDSGSPYEPTFKARTDQDGNYRITGVPSGTYGVAPAAPAFVVTNKDNSGGETLVVIAGETVEGVNFELVRGGVISGKIVDAEGRPVIEQPVFLFNADAPPNQRLQGYGLKQIQTDDRGFYRIFGIAAGRYKVAAGQGDGRFQRGMFRNSYQQTFYPDVFDSSKASVIEVGEGSDTSNINMTLRTVQTFAASGRVIDGENGQPMSGVRLGLQIMAAEQRGSYSGTMMSSNSKGEFKLENLRSGNYGIFIMPEQGSDLRSDVAPFEISDQDVNDIVIKTTKGLASVSGVVVLENTQDKLVWAKLLKLHIYGYVQKTSPSPTMGNQSPINLDGSFTLGGLDPGSLYISLGGEYEPLMKGFNVARIERNGMVEGRNIEIKNGERITDIRVVVTYGNAIVHGVVKFDNGPLPAGARVNIRVKKDGTDFRPPRVDARGSFIMDGMPAGTYELEVNLYIPGKLRKPQVPTKQMVNVADGVVTDVIINVENPDPTSP
jgi:protocatechuate 3,4-dioxygenase beta subunit